MAGENPNNMREDLRAKMIENAAEINRLHHRIHETCNRRDGSDDLNQKLPRLFLNSTLAMTNCAFPKVHTPISWIAYAPEILTSSEVALCFFSV